MKEQVDAHRAAGVVAADERERAVRAVREDFVAEICECRVVLFPGSHGVVHEDDLLEAHMLEQRRFAPPVDRGDTPFCDAHQRSDIGGDKPNGAGEERGR